LRYMTIIIVLCSIVLISCASSSDNIQKSRYSFNRISFEEIQQPALQTALMSSARELIDKLRPNWLRGGGSTIYLNSMRYGKIGQLSSISTTGIVEIRFYNTNEALEFGTRTFRGVIDIITR